MRNWTIQRQLGVTFVALLLISGAGGAISSRTVHELVDRGGRDSEALAATVRLGVLSARLSAAADMVVVAAFNQDRQAVEAEWAGAEEGLATLEAAAKKLAETTNVPDNVDRASKMAAAMRDWYRVAGDAVTHARALRAAEASSAMEASEHYSDDVAAVLLDQIVEAETSYAEAARLAAAKGERNRALGLIAIALLVVAVVVSVLRKTDRTLRHIAVDLEATTRSVVATGSEVAQAATSLSQGASEQAATLEEASASMEEMSSMTRQNAENSSKAAALVSTSERYVNEASAALRGMVHSMSEIAAASSKVAPIIKTIDDIAFQTNILALNAAVEAARAGEAGMGFAVVADEVRNLAQRSAQAAHDTSSLIEESITRSKEGSERVDAVVRVMAQVVESSTRVKGLVDQVSEASRQQSTGIDQLTQAVTQLGTVTQQTSGTAASTMDSSKALRTQADTAWHAVERLQALVGGESSRPAA
jgi:methyl-accepting chemotaxis protein/methyl-accepting chemotaxis protein-1 (serine sensor receptor)